jgi:AraC-like DNA-binding protein
MLPLPNSGATLFLDLGAVAVAERRAAWSDWMSAAFPGFRVVQIDDRFSTGTLQGAPIGSGWLWTAMCGSFSLIRTPRPGDATSGVFTVMLQRAGTSELRQNGRQCRVTAGDIVLVDGLHEVQQETFGVGELLLLLLPRQKLLGSMPELANRTALRFAAADAGTSMLRELLRSIQANLPGLTQMQQAAALSAVMTALGVLPLPNAGQGRAINPLLHRALHYIERNLGSTGLSAEVVADAQCVSRRRLDDIFVKAIGSTVASQIWELRLLRAAEALSECSTASRSITDIAYALGFADSAHFARSFRKRFGCTARSWRKGAQAPAAQAMAVVPARRSVALKP